MVISIMVSRLYNYHLDWKFGLLEEFAWLEEDSVLELVADWELTFTSWDWELALVPWLLFLSKLLREGQLL